MIIKPPVIWDLVVRLTHWVTATLFLANFFFSEGGSELHQWLGYGLLASLFVRLIWGFIGNPFARFSNFLPSITSLKHYLSSPKSSQPSEGHNPLGALMAFFLWTGLIICVVSGHLQETDIFWGEDWPELVHEISSDLLMVAVTIHVTAIITLQKLTGKSPIKGMIMGKH